MVIITIDVALNAWFGAMHGFQLDAFIAQSLFLAFSFWRRFDSRVTAATFSGSIRGGNW